MRKPGEWPGFVVSSSTSIIGGWKEYMCKVFLVNIASVDRGFRDFGGSWGLDRFVEAGR